MPDGSLPIAGPVVEEADALVRADVVGRDAEDHVPLVERIGVIVPVGEDTGVEIVSVGQVRVTTETGQRHLLRRLELPSPPERFAQAEKDQTGRVRRQLGGEGPDVFNHGNLAVGCRSGAQPAAGGLPRGAERTPRAPSAPAGANGPIPRRPPGSGPSQSDSSPAGGVLEWIADPAPRHTTAHRWPRHSAGP